MINGILNKLKDTFNSFIEGVKDNLKYKISTIDKVKVAKMLIPFIIIFYVSNKLSWLYGYCIGKNVIERVGLLLGNFNLAFINPMISIYPKDIIFGLIICVGFLIILKIRKKNAKKYRKGVEYGSARWGERADIAPFIDPVFDNNIILTQTEFLTMNQRPKKPKYARNKNIIVVGGSGSGKTRFYVKPNIMQMHKKTSYIVTDPKGTVILEVGDMLVKHGYKLKVLNTINFNKSMHYNPFNYIHSEKDILKLVNTIIQNTKGEGEKSAEDFWVKSERLLYCALIGYIYYEAPKEEQNFTTLLEFLNASETREEDEEFQNAVDILFEELEERSPKHFAVRQYKKYKLAAGKTAKSILISCGARLAPFDIEELQELTSYDEMELDKIGEQKTALFIIVSDTDSTFNFIVAMMYSQLFNLLCEVADDKYGGRLPYHVRFLLDEFANLGTIPMFDKLIATIRSREISASIILQSLSQLKTIYKDASETIIGNCDTMLFLGGKESSTIKELSETLGKETIDLYNTSDTRGQSRSLGINYQKLGKDLMTRDEISVMDGEKCILQLRGVRPFFSNKYDITKHKRYMEIADGNEKLIFDVEKYMKKRARINEDTEFYLYEEEAD
ncbi:MAG: type IV secretory system conjugative DNA transfer family protein [Lachnospiraceae bacterium]|nr:type IV secretory system conjugative DNA transfer family protein [Lachnospiraceae bacterium]